MSLQSTLASGEKAGILGLNLLNELEYHATRRFSRHHDRIPILLEHKISVQSGQSELCDHVEFIDMTPTSLRMRFTLAQWMDGTLSIQQYGVHDSISHCHVISVLKNQIDAVFISPQITLN